MPGSVNVNVAVNDSAHELLTSMPPAAVSYTLA